jgi:hypothetical protein
LCCAPVFFLVHGFWGFASYAAKVLPAIFCTLQLVLERMFGRTQPARARAAPEKTAVSFAHEDHNKEGFFESLPHSGARSCQVY